MIPREEVLKAAEEYADRGWVPIPISPKTKRPIGKWGHIQTPDDGLSALNNRKGDINVGVHLGDVSGGLVDVDIDCEEALALANRFLPPTDCVFGRPSKRSSHRLYICPDWNTRVFRDFDKSVVIELRANNKAGKTSRGAQTVLPPSWHAKAEERIEWESNGAPAEESGKLLEDACTQILAIVALTRRYPTHGARHDYAMCIAGSLGYARVGRDVAKQFIGFAAELRGDDEIDDRLAAVDTTYDLLAQSKRVRTLRSMEAEGTLEKGFSEWLAKTLKFSITDTLSSLPIATYFGAASQAIESIVSVIAEDKIEYFEHPDLGAVRILETQHGTKMRKVDDYDLERDLSKTRQWGYFNEAGKFVQKFPEVRYCMAYLSADCAVRDLPPLRAFVKAPTLHGENWEPVTESGYHEDAALFVDWHATGDTAAPDMDIDEACELLEDLTKEIRFSEDALGLSVWVFALLMTLTKNNLGPTPMIFFDAPMPGSGKTYAVELISEIAYGRCAAPIPVGWNDDELQKRLDSALFENEAMILLDNLQRRINSDVLCQMLTSDTVKIRILGRTERVECKCNAVVFATANNGQLGTDLVRRTLATRIDPQVEDPYRRKFFQDPIEMVRNSRGKYISAALSIVRRYVEHVEAGGQPVGDFEHGYQGEELRLGSPASYFSSVRVLREALVWAGFMDPFNALETARNMDVDMMDLVELVEVLHALFGDAQFTAGKVQFYRTMSSIDPTSPQSRLGEVLGGATSSHAVGKVLSQLRGRIVRGRKIEYTRTPEGAGYRIKSLIKKAEEEQKDVG